MLKKLAELFAAPLQREQAPWDQAAVALCVVLLEAARADSHFREEERAHILEVLREKLKLSEGDAESLLEEAIQVRDDSTDFWQFTRALNEAYTPEEKTRIMEDVWRIIFADGMLDAHEDHLAHKLRGLLNLDHPTFIRAKMKVLEEIRGK